MAEQAALAKRLRKIARRETSAKTRVLHRFPQLSASLSRGKLETAAQVVVIQGDNRVGRGKAAKNRKGFSDKSNSNKNNNDSSFGSIPKRLLKSSEAEISALKELRTKRFQERLHSEVQHGGHDDQEEELVSEVQLVESVLGKVRVVAERLLQSCDMDLRGFEGEAMTPDEFRVQLRTQFNLKLSPREVDILVDHLDDNSDGLIDYNEVVQKFLNPDRLRVQLRSSLRRSALDKFRATMDLLKAAIDDRGGDLSSLFAKFDQNGDNRISREEFAEALLDDLSLDLAEEGIDQVFDLFDAGGDGTLVLSEFRTAFFNRRAFEQQLIKQREQQRRRQRGAASSAPFRLANSREALPGGAEDDQLVRNLLAERYGVEAEFVVWDEIDPDEQQQELQRFDAFVPRSTWDYHLKPAAFKTLLRRLAEAGVVPLQPLPLILWSTDKRYLVSLRDAGIPVIRTRFVDSEEVTSGGSLATILAAEGFGPDDRVVLKPCVSASSFKTILFTAKHSDKHEEDLVEILKHSSAMLQPFVQEITTEGELSLVFMNGKLGHVIVKRPAAGDFRVQEEHGGYQVEVPEPDAELVGAARKVVEHVTKVFNEVPLYVRVDGVRCTEEVFRVMELEAVEPALFLNLMPNATGPEQLAQAIADKLKAKIQKAEHDQS
ncbi:Cycloserine biosynthesis protein DcsG [Durusdinium trenchii]|uniref:Cycloserine biosynthesis protein DcsG n=1 Tax=Durusdinium trenchii TaxID=1381693 RepID=A0ABP0KPG1_9DINO